MQVVPRCLFKVGRGSKNEPLSSDERGGGKTQMTRTPHGGEGGEGRTAKCMEEEGGEEEGTQQPRRFMYGQRQGRRRAPACLMREAPS